MSIRGINPSEGSQGSRPKGGNEPPDRPRKTIARSTGFLKLAFALAMGFSVMFLYAAMYFFQKKIVLFKEINFVNFPDSWSWPAFFASGAIALVIGFFISFIYNELLLLRYKLFGLESGID